MGKPYSEEIARLAGTVSWAATVSIDNLVASLAPAFGKPLVAVGSGGSLTACQFMATLHRRIARQPARVCTPLAFLQEGACEGETAWFISAGGSNSDIVKAFAASVEAEPRMMGVLCGDPSSALGHAARACTYCDAALFDLPAGKDGFLATNSILAFCVLLTRAYDTLQNGESAAFKASTLLHKLAGSRAISDELENVQQVLERETLIVLHGAASRAAACDLESRFTEAALGHVQAADYRNFAHGRHHWLAKHEQQSGIVAFIGDEESELASKTLGTLPASIPVSRVSLSSDWKHAALEAIAISFRLAQWKGALNGIDPGRPGVPLFGHHIYELEYDSREMRDHSVKFDGTIRSVLERKTGHTLERLAALGVLDDWFADLDGYRMKLRSAHFAAVVFDYDGTLVGPKKRTEPPEPEISRQLERLLDRGVMIGIATGRGVSVRDALRRVLPKERWDSVEIGYYNGAVIAALSDDSAPVRDGTMCRELDAVARVICDHRELRILAKITQRPYQITLEPKSALADNVLWAITNDVVRTLSIPGVRVVRSSHSADVLGPGVSKRNVVDHVWKRAGSSLAEPLCIGDRGRWPGNDFELLAGPHSLSVDEVSNAADRCWNLAAPRVRGVEAAKAYLLSLQPHESGRGVAFVAE